MSIGTSGFVLVKSFSGSSTRLSVLTTSFLGCRNRLATLRASVSRPPVLSRRSRITARMPLSLNSESFLVISSLATFENVDRSM